MVMVFSTVGWGTVQTLGGLSRFVDDRRYPEASETRPPRAETPPNRRRAVPANPSARLPGRLTERDQHVEARKDSNLTQHVALPPEGPRDVRARDEAVVSLLPTRRASGRNGAHRGGRLRWHVFQRPAGYPALSVTTRPSILTLGEFA